MAFETLSDDSMVSIPDQHNQQCGIPKKAIAIIVVLAVLSALLCGVAVAICLRYQMMTWSSKQKFKKGMQRFREQELRAQAADPHRDRLGEPGSRRASVITAIHTGEHISGHPDHGPEVPKTESVADHSSPTGAMDGPSTPRAQSQGRRPNPDQDDAIEPYSPSAPVLSGGLDPLDDLEQDPLDLNEAPRQVAHRQDTINTTGTSVRIPPLVVKERNLDPRTN